MLTLNVKRLKYNLRVGTKKEIEVLNLTHKSSKVANDVLTYLLNSGALEGGDVITSKNGNKITQQFTLCNICCKQATDTPEGISCEDCLKTVQKVVKTDKGNKIVEGIIETIKKREIPQLKPAKMEVVSKAVNVYPDVYERTDTSYLRNTFL
jgi:hypothetical protein